MQMLSVGFLGSRNRSPVLSLGSGQHELGSGKSMYVTHRSVLALGTRHALMNACNDDMGVQNKFGLERENQ